MAPSPDNDTAPKAPDQGDKSAEEPQLANSDDKKPENALNELNDRELQDLLEEAVNYKNPTDREGKSILFNYLLNEAEQEERNSRASRAGGSERVRYHNPSAKRQSKHRKKQNSVSENVMHGGSLDNLNKDELYEHSKKIAKKSVSARQREGGSLPSNVNAGVHLDVKYFQEEKEKMEVLTRVNQMEVQRLLDDDSLDNNSKQNQEQQQPQQPYELLHPVKYTSRATLQVNNVDDAMHFPQMDSANLSKLSDTTKFLGGNKCIYVPNCKLMEDVKKVDENGNALQQNCTLKAKKKKLQTERNVVVCTSENVEGHRGDIIDDVNKLMEYIGVPNDKNNRSLKSKQLNRHTSEDKASGGKKHQRAHSSKSKEDCTKLKKSNSLGEISTASLEDFGFRGSKEKVVMRTNKIVDKPRERRSWGNVEPPVFDNLYSNASGESLEAAEFRVVTKKKKSRKRPKPSSTSSVKGTRAPSSPDIRRKSACSVPHSEKSNDSSDVDSVHSLPIDPQRMSNMPISYADIARNSDANKPNKKPPNNSINNNNNISSTSPPSVVVVIGGGHGNVNSVGVNDYKYELPSAPSVVTTTQVDTVAPPPDFNNFKNFPAITTATPSTTKQPSNNNNKTVVKCKQNDISMFDRCLPHDIPDVSTIEKLQMMGRGHHSYNNVTVTNHTNNNNYECTDYCDRTTTTTMATTTTTSTVNCHLDNNNVVNNNMDSSGSRVPPVVILSGNKDVVPGLVFGFDINEQLLHEDEVQFDRTHDFVSRYVPPKVYTSTSHNHDKIVTYIGSAWEEVVFNLSSNGGDDDNSKVRYYSDLL